MLSDRRTALETTAPVLRFPDGRDFSLPEYRYSIPSTFTSK
jgi:hypothetical protein